MISELKYVADRIEEEIKARSDQMVSGNIPDAMYRPMVERIKGLRLALGYVIDATDIDEDDDG